MFIVFKPFSCRDMSLTKYDILVEDILMYLLVWGEAANLRHMPECLCCLFHKTMQEHVTLKSQRGRQNGRLSVDEQSQNRYPGYFLDMVVTPVYEVVSDGLKKGADHFERKTYDDFNEFFWSPMCIKYRIHDQVAVFSPTSFNGQFTTAEFAERGLSAFFPSAVSGFYNGGDGTHVELAAALKAASKTYVEKRSWLHPLYSMHRVFEWHVITFTLLAVLAFQEALQWTYTFTLQVASFIFWEITFFSVLWTILEVWTVFPNASLSEPSKYGFLIRLLVGYLVLSYQTVYFHWAFVLDKGDSSLQAVAMFKEGDSIFWWWQYIWLSVLTSSFYIIESFLCWTPSVVSGLLSWKNEFVEALLNICYPLSQLYVGKVVHVPQKEVFGYILYWLTLISFKLWFGYNYVVFPVTVPTLELYDDYMNYESISFVKTSALIFFWWFPHFLVYIIDLSIWYSVWSSVVGGGIAIVDRQGAVRESKAFRSHFMRAPLAIVQKLMPTGSAVNRKDSIILKASTASLTNLTMVANPSKPPPSVAVVKKELKARNDAIKAKLAAAPTSSLSKNSNRAKSSADLMSFAEFEQGKEEGLSPNAASKSFAAPSQPTTPTVAGTPAAAMDNVEPDLAESVATFLDVRSQRWVIFARIWNEIINKLRDTDEISNTEKQNFLFTNFDWLTKPTYLPLYQTAGSVGLATIAFKEASSQYLHESDSQKKMVILEGFSKTMNATFLEAVQETWFGLFPHFHIAFPPFTCLSIFTYQLQFFATHILHVNSYASLFHRRELTAWILSSLLGENHMKDVDRIVTVLFNW